MSTPTITPNPKLIEFLSQMPDGYRERALRAVAEQPDFYVGIPLEDISDAIYYGFLWLKTKELGDWWENVYRHYRYGKPLPPLPSDEVPKTNHQDTLQQLSERVAVLEAQVKELIAKQPKPNDTDNTGKKR